MVMVKGWRVLRRLQGVALVCASVMKDARKGLGDDGHGRGLKGNVEVADCCSGTRRRRPLRVAAEWRCYIQIQSHNERYSHIQPHFQKLLTIARRMLKPLIPKVVLVGQYLRTAFEDNVQLRAKLRCFVSSHELTCLTKCLRVE